MLLASLCVIACASAAPIRLVRDIPIGAVLPGFIAGAVAASDEANGDASAPLSGAPAAGQAAQLSSADGGPAAPESNGGAPTNNGEGLQGGMQGVPDAIKNGMQHMAGADRAKQNIRSPMPEEV